MAAHVGEVQVFLSVAEVSLKGGYLLPQYQELLDEEQLAVHCTTALGYSSACKLRHSYTALTNRLNEVVESLLVLRT